MSVSQNSFAGRQRLEQHSFAFRISLAASIGFTLGHLLGWDFPFLPSRLAVQLLSARRSRSEALGGTNGRWLYFQPPDRANFYRHAVRFCSRFRAYRFSRIFGHCGGYLSDNYFVCAIDGP
jgi:hypothetical protein